MSHRIAKSARVDPGAELGRDVVVGEFCSVERGVQIGDGTRLGDGVRIRSGVRVGPLNTVGDGTVIKGRTVIGCGNTIHCKACTIRNAVMETFDSSRNLHRTPAYLNRAGKDTVQRIRFLISTEKLDEIVLLRIDEVAPED